MHELTVNELKTELLKYHKVLTGYLVEQNYLFTVFPFMGTDEADENLEKLVSWLNEKYKQIKVEPEVILQNAIKKKIEELEGKLIKIEDIESPIFKRTEGQRDELERLLKQIADDNILSN